MVKIGKIGKNWKSERASRKRVLPARRSFPVPSLMMISTQVVKTSVTIADNSPSQDYTHSDDQTTLLHTHTHTHTYIYIYIHKVFWNIPEAYVRAIFSNIT